MKEEFKRRRPAHLLGARKDPSIIGSFHSLLMYLSEREKKYVSFIICYMSWCWWLALDYTRGAM